MRARALGVALGLGVVASAVAVTIPRDAFA
jgi:hypothetical protein